jgi:hypothetical protein
VSMLERQHTPSSAPPCVVQGTAWAHGKGGIRNIRGMPAVCLAWAPDRQLLAIAWQDGAVSLWDAAKCHLEEDSKTHRQPVSQLLWHPGGRHFMTADAAGKVRGGGGGRGCWQAPVVCPVITGLSSCMHCACLPAGRYLGGEQPPTAYSCMQPC